MENYYIETAFILNKVCRKEASMRSLIYKSNLKNKKKLLRLCYKTAENKKLLGELLNSSNMVKLSCRIKNDNDRFLVFVLLYENVFGKGFPIEKRTKNSVCEFSLIILELKEEIALTLRLLNGDTMQKNSLSTLSELKLPRYARVNTLKNTLECAISKLKESGWQIDVLKDNMDPKKFRKFVSELNFPRLLVDPHVENLLIFPAETDLHDSPLVKEGALILQNKASCLPAFVLNPKSIDQVVDACAAPGMKTTHLASIMKNKGRIWAFDKNRERINTLKSIINLCDVQITTVQNLDFLKVDVEDRRLSKVKYALVDPPCSGSGMTKRAAFFDDEEPNERRISALSNFQAMLLKHAFKLPSLERLVYSTCSLNKAENESVIYEALQDPNIGTKFQLIDPLPKWRHRGYTDGQLIDIGGKCLRATPTDDLTDGFFVALFQRIVNP